MLNYSKALYGPVYRQLGTVATLAIGLETLTFTVIDKTAGIAGIGGNTEVQSEVPGATVRGSELVSLAIDPEADLDGNQITFNGNTWLIASHRPLPSPGGDADGEYMLILEAVA